MRATDGNTRLEDIEYVPEFIKCKMCQDHFDSNLITWEPKSFAHYCPDCLPLVLQEMKYEEDGPPDDPENYKFGFADNH